MELKLYIRQTKLFNAQAQEIYIDGGNPQSLQSYVGSLPNSRRWSNYNDYINVTDSVSDLFKLKLTWTLQRDNQGILLPDSVEQKKTSSGIITFEGAAYGLLKSWLIDDVSAPLNRVDVQILHVGCGSYTDWTIRATDITWCEDTNCTFDITLKQSDDPLSCVKRTFIADNHQEWFGDTDTPKSGKRYPRFSYCNESRPNGLLIALWFVISSLMPVYFVTSFLIATIWNSIVVIFITILSLFAIFSQKLRDKITDLENSIITLGDIKDIAGNFFVESAGCGREHPAPFIRDYISNVCSKCGVTVNAQSAPIFFSQQFTYQTSLDKQEGAETFDKFNPHYNACYLGAVSQKGVRRFEDLSFFSGVNPNNTDWWKPENAPLITLSQLADQLKQLYNADWRVVNNVFYFQRKDYWTSNSYAFDFSKGAPDRALLLEGLCFEWDEVKDPVIIDGLYSLDAADTPGNAAIAYMNGAVSFGNTDVNPNLEGVLSKITQFGATKFRLDGSTNDYVMDAMQNVINFSNISLLSPWTSALFGTVAGYFQQFADYALLISQETTTLPKILIWDGVGDYSNAKAVRWYSCTGNVSGAVMPMVNTRYNNNPTKQWVQMHRPDTRVSGSKVNIAGSTNYPYGYYTVRGTLGGTVYQSPAFLINYPMYFAHQFRDSMWDWFHWIDDPLNNPVLHQNFTAKLDLCCDTLKRIQPFNDGDNIILGQKVKLPVKFYPDAYIKEITISYDTSDELGQYIEIKGRL